jgi:hypothetical protein
MKKFASFFAPKVIDSEEQKDQIVYTKTEYVHGADENSKYEVYEKNSKTDPWGKRVDARPTLEEAEERAKMKPKVIYQGLYRKGERMDEDYVQERKEADKHATARKKVYKDYSVEKSRVDGNPVQEPVYLKPSANPEYEIEVELERKKGNRLTKG